MGAAPTFPRQDNPVSPAAPVKPIVLQNKHLHSFHAPETAIETAFFRCAGEQSLPPSLPVPGLVAIRPAPHATVEAVSGEDGAFCLGAPCLNGQEAQWLHWSAEDSEEQCCRIGIRDFHNGLWLSRLEKPGRLQAGIGGEFARRILPLPAHRHHIRIDAKGTHSLIDYNPGFIVVLSNKDTIDSPHNSLFHLEKIEEDGDAIIYRLILNEGELDAATNIPSLFIASRMTFLAMRLILLPCRIEIDAPSNPDEEMSADRSITLRLLGKQTARAFIFTEGPAAAPLVEIKLTPQRNEQTVAIPNAGEAAVIPNAIRIETDETLIDRRIHRIAAMKSIRLSCWPPLICWENAKRAAFGVFQNENDEADWDIMVPAELAEARVETEQDHPCKFYIDLPDEGPPPPWTGYITLRDRMKDASGSVPIVRMGENKP